MLCIKKRHNHFTDYELTTEDSSLGEMLAYTIGDTFINTDTDPPVKQWETIAAALRLHGLRIVEETNNG